MKQIVFTENGSPVCIIDKIDDISVDKLGEIIELEEILGRDFYYTEGENYGRN